MYNLTLSNCVCMTTLSLFSFKAVIETTFFLVTLVYSHMFCDDTLICIVGYKVSSLVTIIDLQDCGLE